MEKLSKEIERILKQETTNKAKQLKAMQIKQLTDFIKNENLKGDRDDANIREEMTIYDYGTVKTLAFCEEQCKDIVKQVINLDEVWGKNNEKNN